MRLQTLVVLIAVVLACPSSRTAKAQTMGRDSWTGPIAPGSAIHIVNNHGDIRLRHGGSEGNLEVAAVFQQLAIDGSTLVLEVAVTDDLAEVTVVRLDSTGKPAPQAPRGDKARSDLAVLVPEGFPVRAEGRSGLIEAQGVHTDVDLHTVNGTIRAVKTHGRITAHSEGGTIEITLEPSATKAPQTLSSVTGSITVFTPPTNDLDITLATSGAFVTDYSLAVEHRDHEEPNKTATATIGRGGPTLIMNSRRGDLGLRRVVTIEGR
jgi:hypothetical protein